MSKPHAKLTLAYDGSPFAGWAVQPGKRTIEGELRAALATVLREPVALTVAGRTDRGVHALGQVVSYEGELPRLRSVNALLPPEIEKLITLARKGDIHARRQATSILQHPDKGVIYKLFEEIAPRYAERPGGYTRILKLGPRSSDATEMVYLELV